MRYSTFARKKSELGDECRDTLSCTPIVGAIIIIMFIAHAITKFLSVEKEREQEKPPKRQEDHLG
jgi:hypothetical protein